MWLEEPPRRGPAGGGARGQDCCVTSGESNAGLSSHALAWPPLGDLGPEARSGEVSAPGVAGAVRVRGPLGTPNLQLGSPGGLLLRSSRLRSQPRPLDPRHGEEPGPAQISRPWRRQRLWGRSCACCRTAALSAMPHTRQACKRAGPPAAAAPDPTQEGQTGPSTGKGARPKVAQSDDDHTPCRGRAGPGVRGRGPSEPSVLLLPPGARQNPT